MVGAATLEPPKSGRSRFSKALPPPPSLPKLDFDSDFDLLSLTAEKTLPQPQSTTPLPPAPPPKSEIQSTTETTMAAAVKPLDSPLPSLPPKLTGPPLRSIPRRPVAAPVTSASTLSPTPSPAAASPNPLPSPGGSISSLLSAYSDHTDDEAQSAPADSSKGALDPRSDYSVVSPRLDVQKSSTEAGSPTLGFPSLPSHQVAQKQEPGGRVSEGDDKELPPPPPLKDSQRGLERPRTPPNLQQQFKQSSVSPNAGSPPGKGSPQQGELWRRRSLKADKSLAVLDLKLVSGHGSTAGSAQNTSQSGYGVQSSLESQPVPPPPPKNNLEPSKPAPAQRAPPRGAIGGLPGRNIRPAHSEELAKQGGEGSMGQEGSRAKENIESVKKEHSREEELSSQRSGSATTFSSATSATAPSVSAVRQPTPEHEVNDAHNPQQDLTTSSASTGPSPKLGSETKPIARKAIGTPGAQLRHAKSAQTLAPGPDGTGLGVRSPAGLPVSPRPDAGQFQKQTLPPAPPEVDTSKGFDQVQILTASPTPDRSQAVTQKQYIPYSPPSAQNKAMAPSPPAAPSPQSDGVPGPSPVAPTEASSGSTSSQFAARQTPPLQNPIREPTRPRAFSETESIETVKPQQPYEIPPVVIDSSPSTDFSSVLGGGDLLPLREPNPQEPDHTDHPGAARFPRGWYTPLPPDTIPDARPLTQRHYACLTQHRYMTANKQRANPVACRTCGHKDRNAECYICSACYLNVCSGCVAIIRRCKGDLKAVLKEVEKGRSSRVSEGSVGSGNIGQFQ
ncbi:hypothetical protein VTH82DRAFT_798 [Thermothelomyces myriococcoides]